MSNEYLMNIPQIRWILEDRPYAGSEMRIIGHGFADIDLYKEQLIIKDGAIKFDVKPFEIKTLYIEL